MTDKEAKDILANCIADYVIGDYCVGKYCAMEKECEENNRECVFEQAIDTVLAELEKKDKIIDEMANYLWRYDCCEYEIGKEGKCKGYYTSRECCDKCIKEYFKNKVEKE